MAFEKFTWENRISEYPNRRTITNVSTNATEVVDITRNEGEIINNGTSFSAENMNNLEQRISNMFPVSVSNGGVERDAGTWTPQLINLLDESNNNVNPTYTLDTNNSSAYYITFNDLIYITCATYFTVINAGSGYAHIGGLPKPVNTNQGYSFATSEAYEIIDKTPAVATIKRGSSNIQLIQAGTTIGTKFQNGYGKISFSGIYIWNFWG